MNAKINKKDERTDMKTKTGVVSYTGYLTQDKLEKVIRDTADEFMGREVLASGRRRWDCVARFDQKIFVIEFDGERHYREPSAILSDEAKDAEANVRGWSSVRIPYWVQLDSVMFRHWFNVDADIAMDYPHGFIDPHAALPASFCEMGQKKFADQINMLPSGVVSEIFSSLKNKCATMDPRLVIFDSLKNVLS